MKPRTHQFRRVRAPALFGAVVLLLAGLPLAPLSAAEPEPGDTPAAATDAPEETGQAAGDEAAPSPEPSPKTDDAEPADIGGEDGTNEEDDDELEPILQPGRRYDVPLEVAREKAQKLLEDVEDKVFHYDESAFWWMLNLVDMQPAKKFEPGDELTPIQALLTTPSAYRGQPVTVEGALVRFTRVPVPTGLRDKLTTYYEIIVKQLPAGEPNPVATVIATEHEWQKFKRWDVVRAKGYFYKVRGYRGTLGPGLSPMVITKEVHSAGRRAEGAAGDGFLEGLVRWGPVGFVFGGLVIVMFIVFLILVRKGRAKKHANRSRPVHKFRLQRPDWESFAGPGGEGGEGSEPKPDRPAGDRS